MTNKYTENTHIQKLSFLKYTFMGILVYLICQVENQSKINNHGNIKNPQTTDLNLTKTCRGKSKHARHYRTNNITFIVYYYNKEGSACIEWLMIILVPLQ